MELQIQIKLSETVEHDKEVIERLVKANLDNKVSGYLKKYEDKTDSEGIIELKLDKNKKDLFDGKLIVNLDKDQFIYEREDYQNLDDLVNNLFKHLKEELSSK
jgi:ribosomal protein S17E